MRARRSSRDRRSKVSSDQQARLHCVTAFGLGLGSARVAASRRLALDHAKRALGLLETQPPRDMRPCSLMEVIKNRFRNYLGASDGHAPGQPSRN
jgi:hypothetical protein